MFTENRELARLHSENETLRARIDLIESFFESPGIMQGVLEIVGNDLIHLLGNADSARFFETTPEAMLYQRSQALGSPPEVVELYLKHCRESKRFGRPVTFEYFRKLEHGSCWLAATLRHLTSDPAYPERYAYWVKDITERKQAEESLKHTLALLSSISENTSDAIFVKDTDGRYLHLNSAAARMVNKPVQELIGVDDYQIFPREIAERLREADFKIMHGKAPQTVEEVLVLNGEPRTFHSIKGPIRDSQGNLVGLFGIARDITARIRGEAELLRSHALLSAISENTSDAVFVKDTEGRYLHMNSATARFVGKPKEELLGKDDHALFPQADAEQLLKNDRRIMFSGVTQTNEEHLTSGGKELTFLATKGPIFDANGKLMGLFGISREITARKAAEEALKLSEAKARATFDQSLHFVGLLDLDGKIREVNQPALTFINARLEDVADKLFWETPWWKDVPELIPWLKEAVALARTGQVMRRELSLPGPDGKAYTFAFSLKPALDDKGEIVYLIPEGHDITELKAAERALKHSEAKARAVFDQSFQMIAVLDTTGHVIEVNQTALDFAGVQSEDVLGKAFWDTSWWRHSAELQAWVKEAVACAAAGQILRRETTHLAWDGKEHLIDFSIKPVFDEHGKVLWLIPEGHDISERKESEEALLASESRFRALFDSASEPILTLDEFGTVLSMNQAAETVFQFKAEEIVGTKMEKMLPSPYREQHVAYVRRYVETRERKIIGIGREVVGLRKDGQQVHVYLNISEAQVGGKRIFMGILRDLTNDRKAAADKQHLEAQLYQAQKMESLGVLAGGIAHDFNNLLVSVLGYADLAITWHKQDERTVKALTHIVNAGNRAKDLVKQILAFSRRDAQEFGPLELGHVLKDVETLIRRTAPKTIDFKVALGVTRCDVWGNANLLHQILVNLCTNAVQAMPKGGKLRVELDACDFSADAPRPDPALKAQKYWRVTVKDTGTGIDPLILNRIFEPFFSTKGATGTGLGLSVVHGIVRQHHGVVTVQSTIGQGTEFSIFLPVFEQVEGKTPPAPQVLCASGRILLLDDEVPVVELTRTLLTELGYKVDAFTSAQRALDALGADPTKYDLVLTDLAMPEMDGLEVCRKVRALSATLPLGVISALITEQSRLELARLNIAFVLNKPFTSLELVSVFSSHFNRAKQA